MKTEADGRQRHHRGCQDRQRKIQYYYAFLVNYSGAQEEICAFFFSPK